MDSKLSCSISLLPGMVLASLAASASAQLKHTWFVYDRTYPTQFPSPKAGEKKPKLIENTADSREKAPVSIENAAETFKSKAKARESTAYSGEKLVKAREKLTKAREKPAYSREKLILSREKTTKTCEKTLKKSNKYRQERMKCLCLQRFTGITRYGYEQGKQAGNDAIVKGYQNVAGQNLQTVTKQSPDNLNLTGGTLTVATSGQ